MAYLQWKHGLYSGIPYYGKFYKSFFYVQQTACTFIAITHSHVLLCILLKFSMLNYITACVFLI